MPSQRWPTEKSKIKITRLIYSKNWLNIILFFPTPKVSCVLLRYNVKTCVRLIPHEPWDVESFCARFVGNYQPNSIQWFGIPNLKHLYIDVKVSYHVFQFKTCVNMIPSFTQRMVLWECFVNGDSPSKNEIVEFIELIHKRGVHNTVLQRKCTVFIVFLRTLPPMLSISIPGVHEHEIKRRSTEFRTWIRVQKLELIISVECRKSIWNGN